MRTQENNRQACRNTSNVWRLNALAAAMAVAMGGFSAGAFAAAPAANSLIGNTATASYTDASSVPRTATSNTVQTIVQQVGSFTLTADATRYVAPGGQVVYPHTLTNTGNGSDTFNLSAANDAGAVDNFDFAAFTVYADADGNGVPDNFTPVTSVTLAANGVYKFVVVTNAPVTATNAQTGELTVTANTSSAFTPVQTVTNTDTAIISTNAVVSVTKSANITTGPAGTVVTYTLTYTNSGNTAATNFVITDALPKDAAPGTIGTMKYQAGTGVWSGGGSLTDDIAGTPNEGTANTADGAGISYQVMGTPLLGTERIVATVASVPANSSGSISFQVKIDDSTADGNSIARAGVLSNKAVFDYNNGGGGPVITGQQTNIVDFTVTPTASVVANNASGSTADGGANDIVAPNEASVYQGSVVTFNNWIHNTGNSADTFNVTYTNGDAFLNNIFPAGTSFQLYQADGVNVLQDTNSDGIPDTGSLPVGGEYKVVLKATLPANYSGAVNYNVTKVARSTTDPTKYNTVTDTLTNIITNVADLSNNTASGYASGTLGGGGATGAGTVTDPATALPVNPNNAWGVKTVNPGSSAVFPLLVENKRGLADNYNLAAGSTAGMAALPSGWTAEFRQSSGGSCATMGATITNTGTINAAVLGVPGSALVCAVISVPTNAAATPVTPQNIYFKITSPVSTATDTKLDAVLVNTVRSLQMITDRTGQVFPSGTVVYEHILTNNGNVTEGSTAGSMLLSAVNSLSGFNTVLFIDSNSNGVLDGTDRIITSSNFELITTDQDGAGTIDVVGTGLGDGLAGLTKGESIRIFAKVQAPAGATPGTTDSLTVTADVVGNIDGVSAPTDPVNTDTTNVIGGQIRLDKTQALDADCDGNNDAPFAAANISAKPGACIMYKIVATNEGVSPVTSVVINDAVPGFTKAFDKLVGGAVTTATTPTIVGSGSNNVVTQTPADGASTPSYIVDVGTLSGGQTGTFTFSVRIDN